MKITLLSESSLRIDASGDDLSVEADSYDRKYSPFHMLGSSIGTCTHAVLSSWAEQAKLDVSSLTVQVAWNVDEKEHRVTDLRVSFEWPQLPPERERAAIRAAELCSIHRTLSHPPRLVVEQKK